MIQARCQRDGRGCIFQASGSSSGFFFFLFPQAVFGQPGRKYAEELPGAARQMMQLNSHESCALLAARHGQTRHQNVPNENGFKGLLKRQPAIAGAFFGETYAAREERKVSSKRAG